MVFVISHCFFEALCLKCGLSVYPELPIIQLIRISSQSLYHKNMRISKDLPMKIDKENKRERAAARFPSVSFRNKFLRRNSPSPRLPYRRRGFGEESPRYNPSTSDEGRLSVRPYRISGCVIGYRL